MTLFRSAPTGTVRRTARFRTNRLRSAGLVGLVAVALLGLAGCAPNNTPKAYGPEVETPFLAFCTGNVIPVDGVTTTIASTTFCQCAYGVFRDNVPYDDDDRKNRFSGKYPDDKPTFFVLNDQLKDDQNKLDQLPDEVKAKLNGCPKTSENVTAGSVPTGTTPGSVLTTPGTERTTTSGSTPS